ncbi:FabD/lysophospholipase-like protein [Atractiella rhizophila]|nr:FabD/lysophospholipase-like protein [Atractiella rhizophila]
MPNIVCFAMTDRYGYSTVTSKMGEMKETGLNRMATFPTASLPLFWEGCGTNSDQSVLESWQSTTITLLHKLLAASDKSDIRLLSDWVLAQVEVAIVRQSYFIDPFPSLGEQFVTASEPEDMWRDIVDFASLCSCDSQSLALNFILSSISSSMHSASLIIIDAIYHPILVKTMDTSTNDRDHEAPQTRPKRKADDPGFTPNKRVLDFKQTMDVDDVSPICTKSQEVPTPSAYPSTGSSDAQTLKTFKVPENVKKTNDQGIRILAIDNGGICTFSTLYMLEVVMLQVGGLLQVPEGEDIRPCDVFDLICGTSTGGWIALMLGRLGMTVRECIRAYEQIVQRVFSEEAPISKEGCVYSAERLKAAFLDIIDRYASSSVPSSHLPMKDDNIGDRCRTFVVSRYESDAVCSTEMRTYDVRHAARFAAQCNVWEAARATSSDPDFFLPMVIDKTKYVAMGNNNPAALAIDESKRIWGERSQLACLVSLGSGLAQAVSLGHTLAQIERAVRAIVKDCSGVANQVKMMMQEQRLGNRYHRLSVQTMGGIKWEEWERTEDIVGRTKAYMEEMCYEARNAAEYLVQVWSDRVAVRRRLPLPPAGSCFGRKDEVQHAREAILNGCHVAIVGGAGNGKSTVALDTVHFEEIRQALEKISASGFTATILTPLPGSLTTSATTSLH